jgi:hypothetical protein
MSERHQHSETEVVMVKVDADAGIAQMVVDLNEIRGVRTHTSCQGTIGEGGPHPYRAYVMCSWSRPEALEALKAKYIVRPQGNGAWGYVHPSSTEGQSDGVQADSSSGPSGAQGAPTKNCQHERWHEEGYCRECGAYMRKREPDEGAQDAPQSSQFSEWPKCEYTNKPCLDAEHVCHCETCQLLVMTIRAGKYPERKQAAEGAQDAPTSG